MIFTTTPFTQSPKTTQFLWISNQMKHLLKVLPRRKTGVKSWVLKKSWSKLASTTAMPLAESAINLLWARKRRSKCRKMKRRWPNNLLNSSTNNANTWLKIFLMKIKETKKSISILWIKWESIKKYLPVTLLAKISSIQFLNQQILKLTSFSSTCNYFENILFHFDKKALKLVSFLFSKRFMMIQINLIWVSLFNLRTKFERLSQPHSNQ